MKTILLLLIISIFILGGFYFLNSRTVKPAVAPTNEIQAPTPTPTSIAVNPDEIVVHIKDMKFVPDKVTVKKGMTVTWINDDEDMEHNVMQEHENSDESHTPPTVVDPDHFAGPLLAKGEKYSFTFNEVGDVNYHCAPHPWMTGMVTVIE